MAIVKKRKNGWLALLINHLLLMCICAIILLPTSGVIQIIFGVIFSLFYYKGVYDYSYESAKEHSRPYTKQTPSYKFPLYYGFIGNVYFWLPVLVVLILGKFVTTNLGTVILRLIFLVGDSPFIFLDIFTTTEFNELNIWQPILFSVMFFVSTFTGYFLGIKGNNIHAIIKNLKSRNENNGKTTSM